MGIVLNYYLEKINNKIDNSQTVRIALVAFLITLFLFRIPDLVLRPQFWAEDGNIFFREAMCFGPESLFKSYQGYYLLLPRLTAYFASFFDQLYAPAIYCFIAVFLTAVVLNLVLSPRLLLPAKPLLALLIVISANGNEVAGNITNAQWYLAIGLLVVFLLQPSVFGRTLIFEALFVLAAGLTGPFILLMLPVIVFMVWVNRTVPLARLRILVLSFAAFVAASVQAYALMKFGVNEPGSASGTSLPLMYYLSITPVITFIHLLSPYLKIIDNLFHIEDLISASLLPISVVSNLFIAVLAMTSIFRKKYLIEKTVISYFGAVILLSSFYKCRYIMQDLFYYENGDRYFFIPGVMLSWLLVLMFKERITQYAAIALIALLTTSSVFYYKRTPLIDYNWPYWINRAKIDSRTIIPINPAGWSINMSCNQPK
mgnify:CR=1 FL=1